MMEPPSVSPEAGQRAEDQARRLEEYAHGLEMKLTMKSGLLDEAIRLQQDLGARLAVLEEGLTWKDAQLQETSQQNDEAWRSAAAWQHRAERLEEDNCVLRDALVERTEQSAAEIDRLQHLVEIQAHQHQLAMVSASQAAARSAAQAALAHAASVASGGPGDKQKDEVIEHMKKQLRESNQKTVLLEEQLHIRSGFDSLGHDAAPEFGGALPELALLPPADAWAAVGRGAADRICGVTPHSAMDFQQKRSVSEFSADSDVGPAAGNDVSPGPLSPTGTEPFDSNGTAQAVAPLQGQNEIPSPMTGDIAAAALQSTGSNLRSSDVCPVEVPQGSQDSLSNSGKLAIANPPAVHASLRRESSHEFRFNQSPPSNAAAFSQQQLQQLMTVHRGPSSGSPSGTPTSTAAAQFRQALTPLAVAGGQVPPTAMAASPSWPFSSRAPVTHITRSTPPGATAVSSAPIGSNPGMPLADGNGLWNSWPKAQVLGTSVSLGSGELNNK